MHIQLWCINNRQSVIFSEEYIPQILRYMLKSYFGASLIDGFVGGDLWCCISNSNFIGLKRTFPWSSSATIEPYSSMPSQQTIHDHCLECFYTQKLLNLYLRWLFNSVGYSRYELELTTLPHGPTNVKGHFFVVPLKFHLPIFHINQGSTHSKEWPSKNNRHLKIGLTIRNHKIVLKYE